ncbi:autotransporter-associated beta strand repeat-containing protein [Promicromonospora panici]|uniref:autotransporter-associated beta strand repeat-containing protein n=1 Tax=Promicromonospora panici TaxID=2219658 RepID=UPI00101DEFC6|nr:autotransporter-associated beta strand repeat-containing protein [Promicromonospora panici]
MSHLCRLLLRAFAVVALTSVAAQLVCVPAQAATDITDQVRGGENVELAGDATITLGDGEEVVYGGVFSGVGTLTVSGRGKLVLTADSDFQIPEDRRRQRMEILGITNHPYAAVHDPDPPAVTVEAGATLQYGDGTGGTTGRIGHYPYDYPNFAWNVLNHQVDGTLIVAVGGALYHPGILSGVGVLNQPRFIWDGVELAGDHPFSGTIVNGTGVHASKREMFRTSLPNLSKLVNYGSFMIDTPHAYDTVLGFNVFSREWGNDINFYGAPDGSRVIMSGVYSWSDQGSETDPSLSNPDLNYVAVPKNINKRGVNIQGAIVQWGDGTHNRFFLPGTRETIYINLYTRRARGHLIFDYNGPVTLGAPISGGQYHDTMDAVAVGDVTIAGTPGNDVTFADQQNYDGTTTIEGGATLRLGTGSPGQDSWLITGTEGASIVDDGALVVGNAEQAIELSRISGTGSFEQAGPAAVTFTRDTTYSGPTTVSGGALVLAGGTLASSASLQLSKPGATLDMTAAGDQTVNNLSGVGRTMLRLGADTVTIASSKDTKYAGGVEGAGGIVKSGTGTLAYSGKSTAKGPWAVTQGTLSLARAELGGDLAVDSSLRVNGTAAVGGSLTLRRKATLEAGTGSALTVAGDVALGGATLKIRHKDGAPLPREVPVISSGGEISGTFKGLDEGARLDVGGKAYEISYADGRVVLAAPAPAVVPSSDAASEASAGVSAPPSGASPVVVGTVVSVAALGLGALVFFALRRRRGIAGPRHIRRRIAASLPRPQARP